MDDQVLLSQVYHPSSIWAITEIAQAQTNLIIVCVVVVANPNPELKPCIVMREWHINSNAPSIKYLVVNCCLLFELQEREQNQMSFEIDQTGGSGGISK